MEKSKLHLRLSLIMAFMVIFVQLAFFPLHYATHLHDLQNTPLENHLTQAHTPNYINNDTGLTSILNCSLCTLFFHQIHYLEGFQAIQFVNFYAEPDGFYFNPAYLSFQISCSSRGPPNCIAFMQF